MKKVIDIYILSLLVLMGCNTLEDRDELSSMIDKTAVNCEVKQNPERINELYLISSTPKAVPFWDYETGVSNKATDTVFIPFEGSYWIKYYAYAGGVPLKDSTNVVLPQDNDYFSHPFWNLLTNGAAGKTWVWAVGNPYGGKLFGIGPFSTSKPDDWKRGFNWWSTTKVSELEEGEFTLDLNKAFNYYKTTPTGGTQKGNFVFDPETKYIRFQGPKMLKQEPVENPQGIFRVSMVTEDELVLCQVSGSQQRPYYFKRKGFEY